MEFTDNIFLLFILVFYCLYAAMAIANSSLTAKNHVIAAFSLIFYGAWYPPAVLIILFHALWAKFAGKHLVNRSRPALILSVFFALAILFVFKYYNFFVTLTGFNHLSASIILPVGISFYTFTVIGYYVDLWRQEIKPESSFSRIVLFLAFWPHLAAGPVLRAKNIFHNIDNREPLTERTIALSCALLASGLFKKLVLADNIGQYVNLNVDSGIAGMERLDALATLLGFGAQIYADFSGYSDMAIGFALLLGFQLPANFNYPYVATSLTEFWRRWHISLSSWFRDYLYIPLGGNRKGKIRGHINVFTVFFLSGIWHGAGVNFAIWGAIHGAYLIAEKLLSKWHLKLGAFWQWLLTFIVANTAWAYFFLEFDEANALLGKIYGTSSALISDTFSPYSVAAIFCCLIILLADHSYKIYKVDDQGYPTLNTSKMTPYVVVLLTVCALLFSGHSLPFIYFEF